MITMQLSKDMYACGQNGFPVEIESGGRVYVQKKIFKHDFFAGTALFELKDDPKIGQELSRKIVLKINREQSFLFFPLRWLGVILRNHEIHIMDRLKRIGQVPRLIGPYGRCGLIYEFIEGCSLDENPEIPDEYFNDLAQLIRHVHSENICYLDMNKRGNILLGDNRRAYLIDFQISVHLGWGMGWLRKILQNSDRYHLLKHKRRFRPDLLTEEEKKEVHQATFFIRLHRCIAEPYRWVRRKILGRMVKCGIVIIDPNIEYTPENDPKKYIK